MQLKSRLQVMVTSIELTTIKATFTLLISITVMAKLLQLATIYFMKPVIINLTSTLLTSTTVTAKTLLPMIQTSTRQVTTSLTSMLLTFTMAMDRTLPAFPRLHRLMKQLKVRLTRQWDYVRNARYKLRNWLNWSWKNKT